MYSIGQLAKRTQVKVPTIRYYETVGLLPEPERSAGNQRRYGAKALERLSFIKHSRDLGFSIEAILSLIELQEHPDQACKTATEIADRELSSVRLKIEKLQALEQELVRISTGCDGQGMSADCYILASLADHGLCDHDH